MNWSKKVNKSGCSTDNSRLENYKLLIIVMYRMFEGHLSSNFLLLCEWPQTAFVSLLCIYSGVLYSEQCYSGVRYSEQCYSGVCYSEQCYSGVCYSEQCYSGVCYSEQCYSGVCYSEQCCNERMLQSTVFINKIRMLKRTQRNTIGRRSTCVSMTCRDFPLCLDCQSLSLLSFVMFSYQFSHLSANLYL
jgi:hypothetical protein